jgi:uncharacterized membrane protein
MNIEQDLGEVPVYQGKPLTDEHKRLIALFDEMKKSQIGFIEKSSKRIIELSTGLLGVLFAVTAFGDKFPPPYLKTNPLVQWMAVAVLVTLVAALLCSVLAVQPRNYDYYEKNITEMRKVLDKIIADKSHWMKSATWIFFVGAFLLAILVGFIIFSA